MNLTFFKTPFKQVQVFRGDFERLIGDIDFENGKYIFHSVSVKTEGDVKVRISRDEMKKIQSKVKRLNETGGSTA